MALAGCLNDQGVQAVQLDIFSLLRQLTLYITLLTRFPQISSPLAFYASFF